MTRAISGHNCSSLQMTFLAAPGEIPTDRWDEEGSGGREPETSSEVVFFEAKMASQREEIH